MWKAQGVELRLPLGTEFNDPKPPLSNHFANIFVFHADSKAVHNDDCLCYYDRPSKKMGLLVGALGVKHDTLAFHTSLTSSGLTHPAAFQRWLENLVDEWKFDHLCTAHNGTLCGNASSRVRTLLAETRATFAELESRQEIDRLGQFALSEEGKTKGAWSPEAALPLATADPEDPELMCFECG
jgi:hypothetical protein